jgi:hypothetical protein
LAKILPKKVIVKQEISYLPQWQSRNLMRDFVSGKKLARKDPKWKDSGARTALEYEFWTHHVCGTVCLQMLLESYGIKKKLFDLIKDLKKVAAYKAKKVKLDQNYRTNNSHVAGLFYEQFCNYLESNYPFKAKIVSPMTLDRIFWELSKGNHVIASVHPSIRDYQSASTNQKGGHLVLVVGYDQVKKVVIIHNPSGFILKTQENHEIPYQEFLRFFAGRGIVVEKV